MPPETAAARSCSTPFGITDGITRSTPTPNWPAPCAQRLSASLTESPVRSSSPRVSRCKCSTPFGITDGITPPPLGAAPPPTCAQRLSASLTESQLGPKFAALWEGCSTPFGITDGITPISSCGLVTGTRAQRLSASLTESRALFTGKNEQLDMCSTPFGITDGITCQLGAGAQAKGVLNAFRHH